MSYIESEAKALAAKYGSRDPFEIARGEGIAVYFREDFTKLKGMYKVILRRRCIFINSGLSQEEMRYICAHELGHFVLHSEIAKNASLRDFQVFNMQRKTEYEANVFAAHLLIDEDRAFELLRAGYNKKILKCRCDDIVLHIDTEYQR